jgi:hypothetical protein
MTATPLRDDFAPYDLTPDKVVEGPWPTQKPAAVVAQPDALAPSKKKPGPKPGSKNRKRKAKKAKAPAPVVTPNPVPESPTPVQSLRIAAGGEGMLSRIRRISPDVWLVIAVVVAVFALGTALAFAIGMR